MRLSNRSRKPLYSFIYSLVGIIFILGLIGFVLEINKFNVLGSLDSSGYSAVALSASLYVWKTYF